MRLQRCFLTLSTLSPTVTDTIIKPALAPSKHCCHYQTAEPPGVLRTCLIGLKALQSRTPPRLWHAAGKPLTTQCIEAQNGCYLNYAAFHVANAVRCNRHSAGARRFSKAPSQGEGRNCQTRSASARCRFATSLALTRNLTSLSTISSLTPLVPRP